MLERCFFDSIRRSREARVGRAFQDDTRQPAMLRRARRIAPGEGVVLGDDRDAVVEHGAHCILPAQQGSGK